MVKEEKQPFNGTCECGHTFTMLYVPMEMGLVAKILKTIRCPMCGNGAKKIKIPA